MNALHLSQAETGDGLTRIAKPDFVPDWQLDDERTERIALDEPLPCDAGWTELTAPAPLSAEPPPHLTPKQRLKYISLYEAFRVVYRKIIRSGVEA